MNRTAFYLLALLLAVAVAGGLSLHFNDAAVQIDNVHWTGTPAPPCFVDARDCGGHVLGTDANGRDVLARLIVGGRYTLGVALLALAIEFGIAAVLAALQRHVRWIAGAVGLLAESVGALPRLPLMMFLVLVSYRVLGGAAHSALAVAALLGLVFWPRTLRLWVRPKEAPVQPLTHAASDLVTIILLGAAIDFLGWGIFPPAPSWGNMLVDVESNFEVAWWVCVFPALCIFVTVIAIDWLGFRFGGPLDSLVVRQAHDDTAFDVLTMRR